MNVAFGLTLIASFVASFGISHLFSMQTKSAHQSYKTIFGILTKHNLNFRLRWQVNELFIND